MVPITAKLSKRFYDRLGEDVVNELVEWLNQVDASYKAELREQNEVDFARFDAKLEQRVSELRADFRTELHTGFAGIGKEIQSVRGEIQSVSREAATRHADLMKWSFVFWVGAVAAIAMLAGVFDR